MSKIFGTFDDEGFPAGFWQSAAYGKDEAPPAGYIEITAEQFSDLAEYQGARRWNGVSVVPHEPPAAKLTSSDIDAERDRRIAAGFTFGGKLFQAREQDLRNINGAATGAALAMMQGAEPSDPRWQGGDSDFGWIAADNAIVPMDVVAVVNFGRAAMNHVERLTMVGRSLKDRLAAGETLDIFNNALWGE